MNLGFYNRTTRWSGKLWVPSNWFHVFFLNFFCPHSFTSKTSIIWSNVKERQFEVNWKERIKWLIKFFFSVLLVFFNLQFAHVTCWPQYFQRTLEKLVFRCFCVFSYMQMKDALRAGHVHPFVRLSSFSFSSAIEQFWIKFGEMVPYEPWSPAVLSLFQNIPYSSDYEYRCFYYPSLADSIPTFVFLFYLSSPFFCGVVCKNVWCSSTLWSVPLFFKFLHWKWIELISLVMSI